MGRRKSEIYLVVEKSVDAAIMKKAPLLRLVIIGYRVPIYCNSNRTKRESDEFHPARVYSTL